MNTQRGLSLLCTLLPTLALGCGASAAPAPLLQVDAVQPDAPRPDAVQIPGGEAGIGFDDLRYSARLHRVLVPGGRSGVLALVDPDTGDVGVIGGFSASPRFSGGHDFGVTSVDEGRGFLFATDRTARKLFVVDPTAKQIVGGARLGGSPDYVRYVEVTDELWVTEPGSEQIEIFSLSKDSVPQATSIATIKVTNGPESLVIDSARRRAYTHRWDTSTTVIDLRTRMIVADWPNGCRGSRGIDVDAERGFLFAVCSEGKSNVLDVLHDGKVLSTLTSGRGYDVVGYNATLGHLYVAGASGASVLAVSPDGTLSTNLTTEASPATHCVVADDRGDAWFCDPGEGKIRRIADASRMP